MAPLIILIFALKNTHSHYTSINSRGECISVLYDAKKGKICEITYSTKNKIIRKILERVGGYEYHIT